MENIKKQVEDRLEALLKSKITLEKAYLELASRIDENKKILSLFKVRYEIEDNIKENG